MFTRSEHAAKPKRTSTGWCVLFSFISQFQKCFDEPKIMSDFLNNPPNTGHIKVTGVHKGFGDEDFSPNMLSEVRLSVGGKNVSRPKEISHPVKSPLTLALRCAMCPLSSIFCLFWKIRLDFQVSRRAVWRLHRDQTFKIKSCVCLLQEEMLPFEWNFIWEITNWLKTN